MTSLSLIEGCNSPLHSLENSHNYTTIMSTFPPLKWTDKLSKPIRRSKPISESFAPITLRNGLNFLPLLNSTITPPDICSSTKVSPFSLMLGYEPCTYPPLRKTILPALENCLSLLEEAWKEALTAHDSTCWIITEWSSQRFTPWKVGDKVWLEATHLHLHYLSRKLAPKCHGLFKITQVLSPLMYHLQYTSLPHGKSMMSSMPPFFPLIMRRMTWTQLLLTSSWYNWCQRRIWNWLDHSSLWQW